MDRSELAWKMLDWEKARRELDALEDAIENAVLQLAGTVTVGNVKATYSAGRKSYNYKQAATGADTEMVERFVEISRRTKTNWRRVALDGLELEQDEIPFTQLEPSVSLRLI